MRTKYIRKDMFKLNISFNKMVILLLCVTMLVGAAVGAVMANLMNIDQFTRLSQFMDNFFNDFGTSSISKADIFNECIIKYGKTIIILWFLGFISVGAIFIFVVIFSKGLSYGFTTAFIIRQFGVKGILYSFALYIPQNIILIPVYFFIAFLSLKYILKNIGNKGAKSGNTVLELKAYMVSLAIAGVFILLAALTDIFITPYLMNLINSI